MLPYLIAAIAMIGLPTIYLAVRYREYRKFLAGAFFVSSGMQFYFYCAKIPIPLIGTIAVQSPELSGVRGTIHFVLFLVCLYFGWLFHRERSRPGSDKSNRKPNSPRIDRE
jgi:uncharacterized protein (DUF486 family)